MTRSSSFPPSSPLSSAAACPPDATTEPSSYAVRGGVLTLTFVAHRTTRRTPDRERARTWSPNSVRRDGGGRRRAGSRCAAGMGGRVSAGVTPRLIDNRLGETYYAVHSRPGFVVAAVDFRSPTGVFLTPFGPC